MLKKRKAEPPRIDGEDSSTRAKRSMSSLLLQGEVAGKKWAEVVTDIAAAGQHFKI